MIFETKPPRRVRTYRIRRWFAFFPMHLTGQKYIWLEFYYAMQRQAAWNFGGEIRRSWDTECRAKSVFGLRGSMATFYLNVYKQRIQAAVNRDAWERILPSTKKDSE